MGAQEFNNLNDIKEAAIRLFRNNPRLTVWDAVECVLEGMETRFIKYIYRASRVAWCNEALATGGDALISIGVEKLGLELRMSREIRNMDDLRSRPQVSRPRRRRNRRR